MSETRSPLQIWPRADKNSSQSSERSPARSLMFGVRSPYSGLLVNPRRMNVHFPPSLLFFSSEMGRVPAERGGRSVPLIHVPSLPGGDAGGAAGSAAALAAGLGARCTGIFLGGGWTGSLGVGAEALPGTSVGRMCTSVSVEEVAFGCGAFFGGTGGGTLVLRFSPAPLLPFCTPLVNALERG